MIDAEINVSDTTIIQNIVHKKRPIYLYSYNINDFLATGLILFYGGRYDY